MEFTKLVLIKSCITRFFREHKVVHLWHHCSEPLSCMFILKRIALSPFPPPPTSTFSSLSICHVTQGCTCAETTGLAGAPAGLDFGRRSLMEGICPEASHLAHNHEPESHLDCICTIGAWPQCKEIIGPKLLRCRGSGQMLVFLFTSGGNKLICTHANVKLGTRHTKPTAENGFLLVRVLDPC